MTEDLTDPVPRRRSVWPIVVAASIATIVVIAAVVGIGVWTLNRSMTAATTVATPAQAREAAAAAPALMSRIFSFDYRHLDADHAAGLAVTTGAFRQQLSQTSASLRSATLSSQTVTVATSTQVGVIGWHQDSTILLVYLNQQSTSNTTPGGRLDQYRVGVTLQKEGGRWLVAQAAPDTFPKSTTMLTWPTAVVRPGLEAARACVDTVLTYDFTTIDADQTRVAQCSTGDFLEQYEAGKGQIRAQVTATKGHSTPEFQAVAANLVSDQSMTVLIAADVGTSTATASPTVRHLRIVATVKHVGDKWLLSYLTFG